MPLTAHMFLIVCPLALTLFQRLLRIMSFESKELLLKNVLTRLQ